MIPSKRAWIHLGLIKAIGPVRCRKLLETFGSPERILGASREELMRVERISAAIAEKIIAERSVATVDNEIALVEREAVHIVTIDDAAYPYLLKNIYDPPYILYVRGEIAPEDNFGIAIVGTRIPSRYGEEQAFKLGFELASRGITVVSGLARGIDTAAHKGALKAGGRTIAVLGSGLSCIYPDENKALSADIAEHGAVVSEFPMSTGPLKQNFPVRNRIINGLSRGVCVVEAGARSGALITAACARDEGREVFSLPGRVDSSRSRGTLKLIQEGAKLIRTVEDIIEEFSADMRPGQEISRPPLVLTVDERTVYDRLTNEPIHIDEIQDKARLGTGNVNHVLVTLQLKGLVKEIAGKQFVKTP
ncbi:MAG: DNA-processing protein DprA [Candidatus Omnitrophica bacterium]|nr:DNA-processing protein DprA [Candidatus Omnitrophota bacterium]